MRAGPLPRAARAQPDSQPPSSSVAPGVSGVSGPGQRVILPGPVTRHPKLGAGSRRRLLEVGSQERGTRILVCPCFRLLAPSSAPGMVLGRSHRRIVFSSFRYRLGRRRAQAAAKKGSSSIDRIVPRHRTAASAAFQRRRYGTSASSASPPPSPPSPSSLQTAFAPECPVRTSQTVATVLVTRASAINATSTV